MDCMDFQGPSQGDFDNVTQLNRAFLTLMCRQPGHFGLVESLQATVRNLTQRQLAWLAETPFLLFSLQEKDEELWHRLTGGDLEDHQPDDLFTAGPSDPLQNGQQNFDLALATVGFLSMLAERSPHSVRLVCGAGSQWCDMLRERTSIEMLHALRRGPLQISARMAANADSADIWQKLLSAGISSDSKVRRAAQVAALQTFLASVPAAALQEWRSAACKTQAPYLQVAEGKGADRPPNGMKGSTPNE